jgi:HD-GYP domain-containing protein (c-di-GMP phosphodiesterase class II)
MSAWSLHVVGGAEVESTRARLRLPAQPRERPAGLALLAAFAAGSLLLAQHAGVGGDWIEAFVVLAVLYAVAGLVAFEVGPVNTDCSVAPLAAMLVMLPPALIPWCVAAGASARAAVRVVQRSRHISLSLPAVAQVSGPVLAPAAVLVFMAPVSSWQNWPSIAAALGAYVLADFIGSTMFERLAYGTPPALPRLADVSVYAVDLLLAPVGVAMALSAAGHVWALGVVFVPLALLLRMFADERRTRIDHALELSQAYRGTAMLLGDVVETDDAYTGSHSRDVVELAVEVGRRLGLHRDALRDLEFGALLHDVGKIAVPNEIVNKPGKLTDAEWAIMKRHTIEGQRMLENIGGVLARVGLIVRASHEDYDGTGYPDGLAGDAIPIEARICSACDAFSAMTTDRSYRAAMALEDAMAELHRCAGSQFDPLVVSTLVSVLEEDVVARVETAAPATAVARPAHA